MLVRIGKPYSLKEWMQEQIQSRGYVSFKKLTVYDYSFLSMQPNGSPKQPSGQSAYIEITRIQVTQLQMSLTLFTNINI